MLMVFLGWIALQLPLGIWLGKYIKSHQSDDCIQQFRFAKVSSMIRRPTSGNTSTGAFSAPGVQREVDNEAALLRERATWAFIAMFLGGLLGGVLLLMGFFRLTGMLG
jgi:hypothetical protein